MSGDQPIQAISAAPVGRAGRQSSDRPSRDSTARGDEAASQSLDRNARIGGFVTRLTTDTTIAAHPVGGSVIRLFRSRDKSTFPAAVPTAAAPERSINTPKLSARGRTAEPDHRAGVHGTSA